MPGKDNGIVYHYCSLEAFKSIIENKCLWLCDVEKSNDSAECRVLPNAIADELELKFPIDQTSLPDLTIAGRERTRMMQTATNDRDYIPQRAYCISFSGSADLLSQWRGYANDATGLCIGFKADYFRALERCGFSFKPIQYDHSILADEVNHCFTEIENYLKNLRTLPTCYLPTATEYKEKCREGDEIIQKIQAAVPFYKQSGFQEENEFRLCLFAKHIYEACKIGKSKVFQQYLDQTILNNMSESPFSLSPLKFRTSSYGLQSYYELSFDQIKDDLIQAIIIGPKSPVMKEDIYLLLAANGYHIDSDKSVLNANRRIFSDNNTFIRKSELTYR